MAGGYRSRLVPYVGGLSGTQTVANGGGYRSRFGWWFGGFAGASTTPTPTPTPTPSPSGGWKHDPFSYRHRRRLRDDEEAKPPVLPPQDHGISEPPFDFAGLEAQIAALAAEIGQSLRDRERILAELGRLEFEYNLQLAIEHRRRLLAADDEWFMLN